MSEDTEYVRCVDPGVEDCLEKWRAYRVLGRNSFWVRVDCDAQYCTAGHEHPEYRFGPSFTSPAVKHKPKESGAFESMGRELGRLVDEKNAAYGNSVATSVEAMRLLYPEGVKPEQYGDLLLQVRIWDKQMRIATRKDAFGESPFKDIAGYGLLGAAKDTK